MNHVVCTKLHGSGRQNIHTYIHVEQYFIIVLFSATPVRVESHTHTHAVWGLCPQEHVVRGGEAVCVWIYKELGETTVLGGTRSL